uniref:GSVIVT00028321001, GOX n=1 Tax=Arundo donax TaxID=35708 RepID=A0A0A9E0S1_ARUDO
MSASRRPSRGVSTVRAMALNPALSALLTNCSTTFLSLYT